MRITITTIICKCTYDDPRPYPIQLLNLVGGSLPPLTVFACGFSARVSPPHTRTARCRRIRLLSAVAPVQSLDGKDSEGISGNSCLPCQCFGSWSLDRVYAFAWLFPARSLRPPTHGKGGLPCRSNHLWGPARVAVSGTSMERPDSTCHPGLVGNCYS